VAHEAHRFGVMVPYTPMQHLLFAEGLGPLVMTSANHCDDPLIKDDDEAMHELAPLCDALLTHDRPIERAVDDSIVIDAPRGIVPIRRARGYVPTPITLPIAAEQPGLCVGGELKNAVAIVRGKEIVLSQHIGDLSYSLAYRRFERTIDDLQRLFDVPPTWIACDSHPGYLSQRFAKRMARERDLDLIVVQHHHAHLASLLADHERADRIVGIICDGVGYGDDGQAWGGEIMIGDLSGYERVARLRPLRLPGGDAAARQTGRCALSWLGDALGGIEAIPVELSTRLIDDERHRQIVLDLLESNINCPQSSGTGRLFDAAAALLGICSYNHYEAMSPMLLESAASRSRSQPTGRGLLSTIPDHEIDDLLELDHRPLLTTMLDRLRRGMPASDLAWLFHDALADGFARATVAIARRRNITTVGLSGGVFCNTLLTELLARRLSGTGLEVLVHRNVPPNDGGLAAGQAALAACITTNANP
jgi:hydrogenase maturation protein HypF